MANTRICKCGEPAIERVTNVNTGQVKDVCSPCGQKWIAKGGYGGPWWYMGGEPKEVRIISAHIERAN